MLTFPIIWDLSFSSFQMFVGVGIIWLLFIERRIPSRSLSVTLMIIVAIVVISLIPAAASFIHTRMSINRQRKAEATA